MRIAQQMLISVFEWLKLLLRIRVVPGSNLCPETGYPEVFVVFLSPSVSRVAQSV
jgi:hypothetical protein